MTIGKRIAEYRRKQNLTQEEVAAPLGVSAQAVSKWENDLACPDIQLLVPLAALLKVPVESLLTDTPTPTLSLLPEEQRGSIDGRLLRVYIDSHRGDKVRVNVPLSLVKAALTMGINLPEVAGNDALKHIDLAQILTLVEQGLVGQLVEVESANGDVVHVVVE